MADLSYEVSVEVTSAQRNLNNLQKSVNTTTSRFSGLQKAIGLMAGAISIKTVSDYSSSWTDLNSRLRNVTGGAAQAEFALQRIAETARTTYSSIEQTSDAFLRNARTFNDLGLSIQQQVDVSEALNNALAISGARAQDAESVMNALSKAFASGKLSGDNLNTVIETGGRVAQALADGLGVSTLELRKLGSEGKLTTQTVLTSLTTQMTKLREEAEAMPGTIRDGFILLNNAAQELVGNLDQATGAGAGIGSILASMADGITQIARNTEGLKTFAKVMSGIWETIKDMAMIAGVALGVMGLVKAFIVLKGVVIAVGGIFATFKYILGGLWGLIKAIFFTNRRSALAKELGNVNGLLTKGKVLLEAIGVNTAWVASKWKQISLAVGGAIASVLGFFNIQKELNKQTEDFDKTLHDSHVALFEGQQKVIANQQRIYEEVQKTVKEIEKSSQAYYNNNQGQLASIKTSIELINANQMQQRSYSELQKAAQEYFAEQTRLGQMMSQAIKDSLSEEENVRLKGLLTLEKVKKMMAEVDSAYNLQRIAIQNLIVEEENLIRARELKNFSAQRSLQIEDELIQIQREMAKLTLPELERKYYDIAAAADDAARAAIRSEEARRGEKLNANEIAEYYRRAQEGAGKLTEANRQLYEQSRSFNVGWKQAFNEYVSEASNAANRARNSFKSLTDNMNRALDNFVETGKFKFGDFARSVILDILKIEMRAAASKLLGSIFGGGGGLFGGSIIPGFLASGGPAQANKPYIVGEKGPELFVPRNSGTVVPNHALGAGTMQQAQPVVNNYNYNISAVDAQSVARLFATNRHVLLGSMEQARKEMPVRGMR